MSTINKHLSVEEGIKFQTDCLNGWEKVLKPEVFFELLAYAKSDNDKAKSGYDIKRGDDLTYFVKCYMDKEKNKNKKMHCGC